MKPFCLYADATVVYDGRANSTLERGNYLILFKGDQSVSIHGGSLITPRNYMGAGSALERNGNIFTFRRKNETVTINLFNTHFLQELEDWSTAAIVIRRTEKELATKIYNGWEGYFGAGFDRVEMEANTELGPIDILGERADCFVVVEVKRRRVTVKDVTQLRRYVEALEQRGKQCRAYLAAPEISTSASKYLRKHDLRFLQVDFDAV